MRIRRIGSELLKLVIAAVLTLGSLSGSEAQPSRAAAPAASDPTAARVEILSAHFGVFVADPEGRRVLFETAKFPAVIAAPFGWYIIFRTTKPTVVLREEFELPEAPPTWGPGEAIGSYSISPDRRTAVTERIVPTGVGFIANEWRYAPGDPIGAHAIRVFIDGQLIGDFRFEIEAGPAQRERRETDGERAGRMV